MSWLTHLRGPNTASVPPESGLGLRPCHSTERTSLHIAAVSASAGETDAEVEPHVHSAPRWSPRPADQNATAALPVGLKTGRPLQTLMEKRWVLRKRGRRRKMQQVLRRKNWKWPWEKTRRQKFWLFIVVVVVISVKHTFDYLTYSSTFHLPN